MLELTSKFETKDLGLMHYFLGLEVWQNPGKIFVTQGKYVVDKLQIFGMEDCKSMGKPMTTNFTKLGDSTTSSQSIDSTLYRHFFESWMYLVHTRPDTENALIQLMSNTYGLRVTSNSGVKLSGYTDSDWGGITIDWKSTFGYCFSMGSTIISWSSRKQGSIAQSTVEEKYIAASDAYKEAVWQGKIDSMIIHCDNQSCIKISENPVFHDRSKHIEIRYHFIRDLV